MRRLSGTWEPETPMLTEKLQMEKSMRARVRMRNLRGGTAGSSREVPDKGMERSGCVIGPDSMSQPAMGGAR